LPSPEASRANGKKGGRPKGSKSATTLIMEEVRAEFGQRVLSTANRLFNAQLVAAEGATMLFKRTKGGKVQRVTNEREISAFLDQYGTAVEDEGAVETESGCFYFLSAKDPNAEAADRLLNRVMGKPTESLELSGADGKPLIPPGGITFVIQQQPGSENRS
jgi:hypothetical protein